MRERERERGGGSLCTNGRMYDITCSFFIVDLS